MRIQDHRAGPSTFMRDLGRFVGAVLMMVSIAVLAAVANALTKGIR